VDLAAQSEVSYMPKKDSFKQYMKIWAAMSKFVRSHINNGKVVDTQFFGTFFKQSTISNYDNPQNQEAAYQIRYAFCPGPKSLYKLKQNEYNVQ